MHKEISPAPASGAEPVRPARQSAGKRRVPQQERGIKTIEVILRAASEEIARGGLAKLTTKRIAEAAGLSVGGLYEYFPNKEAVVHALASQWLERIKDTVAAIHPSRTGCVDLIRYLDMVYNAIRPSYQQVPGVSVLISLLASVPALTALEEQIDLQVNALLTDAISHLLPYVSREQCSTTARTITILDHHLLIEMMMRGPSNAAIVDLDRRICQHALASHLMLMNEQAQPVSWAPPRPEAPPDVT